MKNFALLAIYASFALLLSAFPASAISVPERLVYDVQWTGMKAVTAVHEVTARGDKLHFVSTTRSGGWLDTFFSVDNRSESVLLRGEGDRFGTPQYYRQINHEGSRHSLREAYFDPQRLTVEAKDLLKKTGKTQAISPTTYDSLSSIYFVRSLDLVPGKSVYLDIYDAKRLWKTEVKVLRREEISTPLGRFKCIVVKPLLHAKGATSKSGDMTIWPSDDKLRIKELEQGAAIEFDGKSYRVNTINRATGEIHLEKVGQPGQIIVQIEGKA